MIPTLPRQMTDSERPIANCRSLVRHPTDLDDAPRTVIARHRRGNDVNYKISRWLRRLCFSAKSLRSDDSRLINRSRLVVLWSLRKWGMLPMIMKKAKFSVPAAKPPYNEDATRNVPIWFKRSVRGRGLLYIERRQSNVLEQPSRLNSSARNVTRNIISADRQNVKQRGAIWRILSRARRREG